MGKRDAKVCNYGKTMRAPKGHFVAYVYLKNQTFQKLLQKAAEEYGFGSQKNIVLPCKESTFIQVLDFADASSS